MKVLQITLCILINITLIHAEKIKINDRTISTGGGKILADEVNVKKFGAKGNGVNDDTQAIQNAINYAKANKLSTVTFPNGRYRLVKGNIIVKQGVLLKGIDRVPAKSGFGSDLCQFEIIPDPKSTKNPTFIVESFSGIVGFSFFYPLQRKDASTPIAYGWTITTNGNASQDGITLRNLMLTNSYQAIKLDNGGQHTVENIYGQPMKYGIYIDRQFDVLRINNIHFWPFYSQPGQALYKWIETNGEAIVVNKADGLQGTNWFAYGYKCGLHLDNAGNGGPWLTVNNILFDVCRKPILIESLVYLMANNVTLTGVNVALSETGLLITNTVKDAGAIVQINGLTTVNFTNSVVNKGICTFIASMKSKIYDGKNNGVRWFDIINENDEAVININIPLKPGDEYRRISGKNQINGQYNYQKLIDVTPKDFREIHNWDGNKKNVSLIENGSRINLTGELNTLSYLFPKDIRETSGIYVLEMKIKAFSNTQALGNAIFYARLRDYPRKVDYSIMPSISDPYFFSETTLKIPFLINSSDLYIDFVFGNATNATNAYIDIYNLKLYKAAGTQAGYKELMPKSQNFTN